MQVLETCNQHNFVGFWIEIWYQDVEDVELDEVPEVSSEQQGFTNMAQILAQKQKKMLKKKIREIQQT